MKDKFILDPCCGPREMWYNKNHPNVVYGDIRRVGRYEISTHRPWVVQPDQIIDFRSMPFPNNTFRLVVFDPPHVITDTKTGEIIKKYASFSPRTWRKDLKKGFDECWRVLQDYGILIFKWSEKSKPWKEIIKIIGREPLFHHPMGNKKKKTYWATFMKLPEEYILQQTLGD